MAMEVSCYDDERTHTSLGRVLTEATLEPSLYVKVFDAETDRRTDGGARDMNTTTVEFVDGVDTYKRDDYVRLTFEPSAYGGGHVLTRVEQATFSTPLQTDEPTFGESDIPTTCPVCGREAAALVKTEYSSMTGGEVNTDADYCSVDPDGRGAWYGFNGEQSFVHGTD